jgi:O-antigen/teichoic acid export membrane protein
MNYKLKKFLKDLLIAFFAQGVSLICSFLISFLVPKALGVKDFGYWQLFIFYISYSGIFHFGFNDGIFLRNGGKKFKELNFNLISGQFWISIIGESFIALMIILAGIVEKDPSRKFVLIATAVYMVVVNAGELLGRVFQAVNESKKYSFSTIVGATSLLIGIILLLLLNVNEPQSYIIVYLLSRVLSLIYCVYEARKAIFAPPVKFSYALKELWSNIKVGIYLTISFYSGILIIGNGRFMIDSQWGVESFGKLSFALSLNNFIMAFVFQIGMVLFPALKQLTLEKIKGIYHILSKGLGILLLGILLCYLPINWLIRLWLPQYSESLDYFVLLLPICTFDAKTEILCNTYLKVLRKEKVLLWINLITLVISLGLSLVGAYLIHDIYFIVIAMVISIVLRNIMAEYYLSTIMEIHIIKDLVIELCLTCTFIFSIFFFGYYIGSVMYLIAYLVSVGLARYKIKEVIQMTKQMAKP